MNPVRDDVQTVLRDVLDQPSLELTPGLKATDVEDWDSLAHVSLMFSLESHFGIQFTDAEMGGLGDVDELVSVIEQKVARSA